MEGDGSFLRLPPPKARHVGIRLWSMDRPSAKARERGGRRRVGAAYPPAAGRSPAAGLFEGQGPGPRTPPPPPGPRAAPWPRGTVAHGRSGGPVGGAGGPGRRYGGAAAKQKSMARGQRPRATLFQGASRPAAAPLRWVFHQRQGSFLQLPCALGFRLASSATGGARLPQFAKAVSWRRKSGLLQRRKATQKPGPTIYGPGYIIHLQEGTRHRPHTSGKAAAHALRAAAEQTPCRGLLTGGDLRPHVREYRRARSTRARSTRARSTRARTTA